MQFLSNGAQYAVSALIVLSREPVGHAIPASDLAKPVNSPSAYLSQVLTKLIPHGIIDSRRGLNGGVYLTKNPEDITIYDIVVAVDGDEFFSKCILGISVCGHIEPCPFHAEWSPRRDSIKTWMMQTTLKDLQNSMTEEWYALRLEFSR